MSDNRNDANVSKTPLREQNTDASAPETLTLEQEDKVKGGTLTPDDLEKLKSGLQAVKGMPIRN